MKLANIYPIKNQHFYKKEEFVMILAHLLKAGLYNPENFKGNKYIIMDNGLFEKAQVSTSLQDCIDLAEASGIRVNEIIVPDVVNDPAANIQLFEDNLETMRKYKDKYTFMFVAQAATYKDLALSVSYINRYSKELKLSVGISKLTPLDRGSVEAQRIYRSCEFPIHLLGIKESFKELLSVYMLIRSCDTSQIAFIAKNEAKHKEIAIMHYVRNGKEIDLAEDECNDKKLKELLESERQAFAIYGIL